MATNTLAPQGVCSRVGSEHGNIALTKARVNIISGKHLFMSLGILWDVMNVYESLILDLHSFISMDF